MHFFYTFCIEKSFSILSRFLKNNPAGNHFHFSPWFPRFLQCFGRMLQARIVDIYTGMTSKRTSIWTISVERINILFDALKANSGISRNVGISPGACKFQGKKSRGPFEKWPDPKSCRNVIQKVVENWFKKLSKIDPKSCRKLTQKVIGNWSKMLSNFDPESCQKVVGHSEKCRQIDQI